MDIVTFENFDPAPYQRVPIVNLASMIVLARALADGTPLDAPAPVHKRADKLHEGLGMAESELTARRREVGAAIYGIPILLDGAMDGLWTYCYRTLDLPQIYLHAGFDPFIAKPDTALGVALAKDRERAERAARMQQRLFGDDGLGFLRATFREQCETTGAIVRLIKEDGLTEELNELVGASLVNQLFEMQEQYEAMVIDQLKAPPPSLQQLSTLRRRLKRLIEQYNNAVLDMIDEDEPKSLAIVVQALRPMVTLRELLAARTKSSGGDAGEGEAESDVEGEPIQDVGEVGEGE